MFKRLLRWFVFTVLIGLLPLSIKAFVLYICGISIEYNDIYSEIICFDIILNIGVINESFNITEKKSIRNGLTVINVLNTLFLAVLFAVLLMMPYNEEIPDNYNRLCIPTIIFSIVSIILSLVVQIVAEVDNKQ